MFDKLKIAMFAGIVSASTLIPSPAQALTAGESYWQATGGSESSKFWEERYEHCIKENGATGFKNYEIRKTTVYGQRVTPLYDNKGRFVRNRTITQDDYQYSRTGRTSCE